MRARSGATQGLTPLVPSATPKRNGSKVLVRNVACPDCMVFIGDPCITPVGKEKHVAHISRRRIAIREGHYTSTEGKS